MLYGIFSEPLTYLYASDTQKTAVKGNDVTETNNIRTEWKV